MRFGQLNMALWLWLVPVLVLFLIWANRHKKKALDTFAGDGLILQLAGNVFSNRQWIKDLLLVCVLFFAILALMRPQWGFKWQEVKREGVDILLIVDTSKSMLTDDIKPNRLERAKLAIKDLAKRLQGDRIGTIAFAGSAFMTCPLTIDYNGFLLALDDLNTETIPRPGTNIGSAIKQAIKTFEKVGQKNKAAVIITDGENFEGDPLASAREAKDKGIKLYCIGVGTKDGELIRAPNAQGEYDFVKDKDGQYVKSRLDEGLLEKIALTTGGVYVRASGVEFGLDLIYKDHLSKMEKAEFKSKMEKRYTERYQFPLAIATVFLILEALIPTRKRT